MLVKTVFVTILISLAVIAPGGAEEIGQPLTRLEESIPAPDFTLPDTLGREHHLSSYRGKVVIVNFWATWCPPCREEMPSMQRAWEILRKDGIEMLAINAGEDQDSVLAFVEEFPVDFTLLLDSDSEVVQRWPIKGLPTTYVLDREGRIVYRALGGREWDAPNILALVRGLAGA